MKKFISRKPSTSNALKGFTAALTELEAVEAAEAVKLSSIQSKIDLLRDEQDAAIAEKDRAATLRARFAAFLA